MTGPKTGGRSAAAPMAHATAKPNHAIVAPCAEELFKAKAALSNTDAPANGVPADGR